MSTPNARFWVLYRGSWVKLSLRPGQKLTTYVYSRHDEGSSFEGDIYRHEGGRVSREWTSGGTDCDGRVVNAGVSACPLGDLHVRDIQRGDPSDYHDGKAFLLPEWVEVKETEVTDTFAQAAGY